MHVFKDLVSTTLLKGEQGLEKLAEFSKNAAWEEAATQRKTAIKSVDQALDLLLLLARGEDDLMYIALKNRRITVIDDVQVTFEGDDSVMVLNSDTVRVYKNFMDMVNHIDQNNLTTYAIAYDEGGHYKGDKEPQWLFYEIMLHHKSIPVVSEIDKLRKNNQELAELVNHYTKVEQEYRAIIDNLYKDSEKAWKLISTLKEERDGLQGKLMLCAILRK